MELPGVNNYGLDNYHASLCPLSTSYVCYEERLDMNTLILLLSLFLTEHSILTTKVVTLYDYHDYSPILIWNFSTVDNIPTPADEDLHVGDKCPTCKGTGTYVSGDGLHKKTCTDCKGDGVLDAGDPLLDSYSSPEKGIDDEERLQDSKEELPTEEGNTQSNTETQSTSQETKEVPVEWEKKVPPLSIPPTDSTQTQEVWSFVYQGTTYYYYPEYDLFVSTSGKKYKVDLSQEEWIKEKSINICTYDSNGNKLTCQNCPLSKIVVPTAFLNYKPVDRSTHLPSRETNDGNVSDYATPQHLVDGILAYLKPLPKEVFLDIGSGDGRVVITAAKNYGCHSIGIEQDPSKIALAQENAEKAGVSHLVTFIQGDFHTVQWPRADVGYVYLFSEDLSQIRTKLLSLDRFVSFAHQVPSLPMYSLFQGEAYFWDYNKVFTYYNGRVYTSPVCNKPTCTMDNYIRRQLAYQRSFR